MPLTQDRLKRLFCYDPKTGIFTRRVSRHSNRWKAGSIVGSLDSDGYVSVRIDGIGHFCHRLAFLYMIGQFPENQIDHRNRIRSDNRWGNLREASQSCNMQNSKVRRDNTSGVRGVYFDKRLGKWAAAISCLSGQKRLGQFIDFDEAVFHRLAAEQCLNWKACSHKESSAFLYANKIVGGN